MKLEAHEFATIFPMLPDAELRSLGEDILRNGQAEPIITYRGKILDGRNRYRACELVDIPPRIEEFAGHDPLAYVISHNLHRRHLTESQRSAVAAKLANLAHGQKKSDAQICASDSSEPDRLPVSQSEAATLLNVSRRSVQLAATVQKEGVPELAELVARGEVKVSSAAEVAQLPVEKQKELVTAGPAAVKAAAKEVRATPKTPPVPDPAPAVPTGEIKVPKYTPRDGMKIVAVAIREVDKIHDNDVFLVEAMERMIAHCNERIAKKQNRKAYAS